MFTASTPDGPPASSRGPTPEPSDSQDSGCFESDTAPEPATQPASPGRALPINFLGWDRPEHLPADITWPLPAKCLHPPHGPSPRGASETLSVWPPDHGYTAIPFNLTIREKAELRYIEQGGVRTAEAQQVIEDT